MYDDDDDDDFKIGAVWMFQLTTWNEYELVYL
jgi:hypothetical protein